MDGALHFRPALWDALRMQEQVDAKAVQLGQEAAEILQRTAKSIDRPTRPSPHEPAPCGVLVHRVEAGTLIPPFEPEMPASRYTGRPRARCVPPRPGARDPLEQPKEE